MGMTTISSREFNQDASGAKRAALEGPVFITDRGRPAHVLLSIEAYQRLTGRQESILDLLADPGLRMSSSRRVVSRFSRARST